MRTTFTTAVFTLLLVPAGAGAYEQELGKLSSELTQKIAAAQKSTLAVVDFTDLQGNVTALGRFLAEELSVALADTGEDFRVIDRIHLASILREHKLSESGLIDPATARQLGQITGVEALITGSITPFGDSVRIAVKILDTESATIIGSARGNIPRTGAIDELLKQDIPGSGGSTAPPSSRPVAARPAGAQAQQTVESDEFSFALRGCRAKGDKVTCDFIITNQSADRELIVRPGTRIFDEFGNEYSAVDAKVGNTRVNFPGAYYLTSRLVSGIPTKAEISFSKVAEEAQLLTMLEIQGSTTVQFRNVPLTR